ncbi:hypothetical protein CC1G_11974 [Coprinopsis cinerea okayama7|uniref:Uncharacterized protein n=1 Tax=Coprinopsis cinerea (strain Okayama-7 / 130 / ATCC MYA-4618 / FGSC 9003) TaxID=240176 RepID=A8P0N2_COPC7|nr:hypothetical protein CC1G_11974 [Coprinopsis cinerea okayama7\|eukprot:XP_001837930.2 hypothetical protein CC1G_11974 [Coprinopsis cinerea okayama7\
MSESDAGHYPIGKTLRLGTKIAGFITVENHGDRQQQPFELGAGTIVDVQSVRLKSSEHHHLPGAQEPSASDYEYLVHSDIYTVIGNIYAPEGKALDGVRGRTRTYPICHTQLAPVGRKKGELAPDGVCRHPLRPGEFAKVINEDTDDYTGTKQGGVGQKVPARGSKNLFSGFQPELPR